MNLSLTVKEKDMLSTVLSQFNENGGELRQFYKKELKDVINKLVDDTNAECPICNTRFKKSRPNTIYCSDKCSNVAKYRRKKLKVLT